MSARHWSFTINNPTAQDRAELVMLADHVVYAVYQEERGENETLHFQGACGFPGQRRLTGVTKLLTRAHWTISRNVRAAVDYAQKEDTRVSPPTIVGVLPEATQGKRNDLVEVFERARAGEALATLAIEHPAAFIKHARGIQYALTLATEARTEAPRIYVFYGPSGTGKTLAAMTKFNAPYKTLAFARGATAWFDGYEPVVHKTVVIDDYYGQLQWSLFLQMCDRYPHRVETKGGTVQFKPDTIIFTSNTHPYLWYKKMDHAPLKRRLAEYGGLLYFPKLGEVLLETDVDGNGVGKFPDELKTQ